jgi:flagellar biosynthesis/type III secretory pathway M-ring protein FliF/YscJ
MMGGDLADLRKAREAELEQKIRGEFNFIDGLTVSVNCDVENSDTKVITDEYDKAKSLSQPKSNTESSQETTSTAPPAREPGVSGNTNNQAGSNGQVSLDGQGGTSAPSNTSNTTKTETTYENFQGHTGIVKQTPAGKDTVLSATVRVPLSYFTNSFKHANPKIADPSDDAIATYRTAELTKIRDGVRHVTGLKSESDLSVDTYADVPVELVMATGPSAPVATLTTVSGHAREIGVAVLAVISLLMMATIVRKSTPAPLVMPSAVGPSTVGRSEELNSLGSGESLAGEVGGGASALDGMEMDEDSVRTQHMLDQVSTMVKENPDGAAALVKRWLSRA